MNLESIRAKAIEEISEASLKNIALREYHKAQTSFAGVVRFELPAPIPPTAFGKVCDDMGVPCYCLTGRSFSIGKSYLALYDFESRR